MADIRVRVGQQNAVKVVASSVPIVPTTGVIDSYWSKNYAGINTVSNVGIGTSIPTSALTVYGNGFFTGIVTAGIVTATKFFGDGSSLVGVAASSLRSGNNIILEGNNQTAFYFKQGIGVGLYNFIAGNDAGRNLVFGSNNLLVGKASGANNTSGSNNTFIGEQSGENTTTGSGNFFVGSLAGSRNTVGTNNNFLGLEAARNSITGSGNNYIGYRAGFTNSSGSYNIFLGNESGLNQNSGDYNIAIGYRAALPNVTGSNQLVISALNGNWIVGDSSLNIGIGTNTPRAKLDVIGSAIVEDNVTIGDNITVGDSVIVNDNISAGGIVTATSFVGDATNLTNTGTQVDNVLYVTKDGNDSNTGRRISDAKRTIKAAVGIATDGDVIKVSAGTYIEDNPIDIPNQVSIVGDSLREVTVTPQNIDKDLFYVGNGNYIAEMSFSGPESRGAAVVAFNPNNIRYNNQSPYIQNCTNFIPGSIGLKVDGRYSLGPTKSMVLDSYTQYNQGGIGVSITNEGYAQLVSLFTICDDIAIYCGSGGACDLTNSNCSFGNYGMVADGVGPLRYTGIVTRGADPNSDTFTLDLSTPTLNVTNAKYDNVSGIITAFTSQPHKFEVGMGITLSGLQFQCPFEAGIRTYPSGANGYVFQVITTAPGRYVDASNLIVQNRREIQDKSLAAIALRHPDFYFPGDSQTNSRSRYYDSYSLIQQNRQEIVDKSLASIAIGFPSGFYFPDEPETNSRSRYYDSSRLIQINKQEIIDKSLGAVAIAHSDFYFPGDSQTNSRSRFFDAYRLIQRNKDVIVSIAWTNTYNVYPGVATSEAKCKRDLGFFIDAISTDVLTGGNNYSREFALQYFNISGTPILNGLQGEETESNYAFVQARELMKQAITNTLVGAAYSDLTITADPLTGFNTSPNSCANVRTNIDNLVGIVTFTIGIGNTISLPTPNYGYFNLNVGIGSTSSPGGFKCARDLGYFVDAVSTDVFTGGNKYSRDFTLQYFDNNGNPISNGLTGETVESVTAFTAARDLMKRAVTNQLNNKNLGISSGPSVYGGPGVAHTVYQSGNENSCADVQTNINNLVSIINTVIGAGTTSSLSTFSENLGISTTNKCARDLGYFVDAVSTDVFTGGNNYAISFTKQYFTSVGSASTALLGEESESVYAFASARELMKRAITNQLNIRDLTITADPLTGFNTSPNSCANVRTNIDNLSSIITQAISAGNLNTVNSITINYGDFTKGGSKCQRDIGYLIDALTLDVRDYTNKNSRSFVRSYFNSSGNPLTNGLLGEESESITAFHAVRDYAKLAINNQLNIKNFALVADPITGSNNTPNSCANVRTFIDNLVGIVTTVIGDGNLSRLPSVSMASTEFSVNVGMATQPHTYIPNTGVVSIDVPRPFDGQVIYFGDLYYSVLRVNVGSAGTGYLFTPTISIGEPDVLWGVPATSVAELRDGGVVNVDIVSSGRGYRTPPPIEITNPQIGINKAEVSLTLAPTYYPITNSTPVTPTGICTVTVSENVPYEVTEGTEVYFYKQSRVLATGISLEYVGSGVTIASAFPSTGGVAIQANETDSRNGGLVVYTSTDQSGNFRIGDGVVVNQQTGTISGTFYSKSLFSTMTPFILALGGN